MSSSLGIPARPIQSPLSVDLGTDEWPSAKQPILHDLSYYMHDGGHGMVASDWDVYLQFLKANLHPER